MRSSTCKPAQALTLQLAGGGGTALPRFVEGKAVSKALGSEIIKKVSNPLIFKGDVPGVAAPPIGDVHGYDVGLLIDICKALVLANAKGELLKSQANIVAQLRWLFLHPEILKCEQVASMRPACAFPSRAFLEGHH